MKKIIVVIFSFIALYTYSQDVGNVYDLNSYKYILIEKTNLRTGTVLSNEHLRIIRNLFLKKKFKVYMQDDKLEKAPDDFKTDSCIILNCYLEFKPSQGKLTDEAIITLKNCFDEIVYENKGSSLWSAEGAYENAFEPIQKMKYEFDPNRKIK